MYRTRYNNAQSKSYIPRHLYRVLVIGHFGSGKTNVLFNLEQDEIIDKIVLYAQDPFKLKDQFLISS